MRKRAARGWRSGVPIGGIVVTAGNAQPQQQRPQFAEEVGLVARLDRVLAIIEAADEIDIVVGIVQAQILIEILLLLLNRIEQTLSGEPSQSFGEMLYLPVS